MKYLMLLFASYLGVAAGSIISHYTKEEIKQGRKYISLLKSAASSLITFLFLDHIGLPYLLSVALSIFLFLACHFLFDKSKELDPDFFFFAFFSIALYETFISIAILPLLIFIFGIASSSMASDSKIGVIGNIKIALIKNSIYIASGIVLFLFF